MQKLLYQPILDCFKEHFPDSIPFGNSTGSGISVRSDKGIEFEIAIFKYIPEQNHFTLTLTYRLVTNSLTNTREYFELFESMAEVIEKKYKVKVIFICPYKKPKG